VDYAHPIDGGRSLFARGDVYYRSDQWSSFTRLSCRNAPGAIADPSRARCQGADQVPVDFAGHISDGYAIVNLSLGLRSDELTIRAFVNNLTDERPELERISGGNTLVATLRPRTIGVRVDTRF
jgi:outer membrane receptor protein involved in Fe transport